jgi:hypothetical protein
MAANTRVWVVQGFQVDTFSVKKDKVKVVLLADKDDISAQDGHMGDILSSLEAHSSGEYPVEVTLGRCNVDTDEE